MNNATKFTWLIFALATALIGQTVSNPQAATVAACNPGDEASWQWIYHFPQANQGGTFLSIDPKSLSQSSNINPQYADMMKEYAKVLGNAEGYNGKKATRLTVYYNTCDRKSFSANLEEYKQTDGKLQLRPASFTAPTKAQAQLSTSNKMNDKSRPAQKSECPKDHTLAFHYPTEAQAQAGVPLLLSSEALANRDNVVAGQEEWLSRIVLGLVTANTENRPLAALTICRCTKPGKELGKANVKITEWEIARQGISKKRAAIGMAIGVAPSLLAFVQPQLGLTALATGPLVSWIMGRGGHRAGQHSQTIEGAIEIVPYYTGDPTIPGITVPEYLRERRRAWGV